MGGTVLDRCKTCGTTARYIMDNGDVFCTAHVPDQLAEQLFTTTHVQPTGCKTFSATRIEDRNKLGERVTEWLRFVRVEVVRADVVQSSDNAYHCLTIVIWYVVG